METKWTVFRPHEPSEQFSRDLPEEPGFPLLESICRPHVGGPIERVRVWHEGQYLDMFVHEMGVLLGLPANDTASDIYWANIRENAPGEFLRQAEAGTLPCIAGNAVLFNRPVWF
jgi:hypothetical protein